MKRGLERRKKQPLKDIGIDETSFQKRHEYVTVILDRNRDIVLDVLDDRKAESLEKWLRDRPAHHLTSVQTVTMDMWDPFIKAVRAREKICFDRFHVYEGVVDRPEGPELERVKNIYYAKFPTGRLRLNWPGIIYLRVRPTWIRYRDFNKAPPTILELDAEQIKNLR